MPRSACDHHTVSITAAISLTCLWKFWNCGMVISKDLWLICPEGSAIFSSRDTKGELRDRQVSELTARPSFHCMSTNWPMLSMSCVSCWAWTNAPCSLHNLCTTWREALGHLLLPSSNFDTRSSPERLLFPADLNVNKRNLIMFCCASWSSMTPALWNLSEILAESTPPVCPWR